ncbi:extracellular solute-binding protein [bacterium]|nr:MAG: extracellular solute-binding protein [bacterium]
MRITLLGKLVIFILVAGFSVGGYKWWRQQQNTRQVPPLNSNSATNDGRGTGTTTANAADSGDSTPSNASANQIEFVITAAKKDWVGEQVDRFNAQNGGKWKIVTKPIPSREAMHAILDGKEQPVLWSPGSPIWPQRLSEAYAPGHDNQTIVDLADPTGYRVFLRSPLVFLTTRKKAQFLRPLLGGTKPWQSLREISLGKIKTPWGGFRFSHADPITSSSGMMTLGLIMYDYAQRTGQSGTMSRLATSKEFFAYLKEMDKSLVYDKPAVGGTTKLTNAFLEDTSRYDVITAYESAALEAASKDSDLAVIYPNPTSVSEHALSLLSASWVSQDQRAGALEFMKFLGGRESLQAGLKYKFRPAQASSTLSLNSELEKFSVQGFQQNYTSTDLPPYEALNAVAFRWKKEIANARQF